MPSRNGTEQKSMTKGEREELKRLARERARVAKSDAERRAADLKAMFEHEMVEHFTYDREEVWAGAMETVRETCEEANEKIARRADELGIPAHLTPRITFAWERRDPRMEVRAEQQDLRRAAYKRIEAMERTAKQEIDRAALNVQTELVAAGLTSEAAVEFLQQMPTVETLMPPLTILEITSGDNKGGE